MTLLDVPTCSNQIEGIRQFGVGMHDLRVYLKSNNKTPIATSATFPLYSGVPQGSVLGPIFFSVYTSPIASITSTHGVRQQQYADVTQLYISFSPSSLNTSLTSLQTCFSSALRNAYPTSALHPIIIFVVSVAYGFTSTLTHVRQQH